MSKLIDFKEKLLGLYHNRNQALSHPQQWAHIYVQFEENDDGNIISKSWYATESSQNPYRQSALELKELDDKIIATIDGFDVEFILSDGYWIAESKRVIPSKNMYVLTSIKFDGENYYSKDGGFHIKNDRFLWGKNLYEGHFHFIKEK
jgi:hypothetical protein